MGMECYECHGSKNIPDYRPLDSPFRNILNGGFQGNHQTHMGPSVNASSCAKCHPGSSGYGEGHRDGKIKLSSNLNNSPIQALYKNSTSAFPQSSTPALGSCSNTNCHFEKQSPVWGSAPLVSPNDCMGTCHSSPPNGGAGGVAGSHAKHESIFPGLSNCMLCHSDHISEPSPFSHASSAANRGIQVKSASPYFGPYALYSGNTRDFLPSQVNTFGSCKTVYCHSTVQGVTDPTQAPATLYAPTWGETFSDAICGGTKGCHGVGFGHPEDASVPALQARWKPLETGSHAKHITYRFNESGNCQACHYNFTNTGDTGCYSCHSLFFHGPPFLNHIDRNITISFNPGNSLFSEGSGSYSGDTVPGTPYGSCSNIYCHSDGTAASTDLLTPSPAIQWGSSSLSCTSCHGYPPSYQTGSPKANSHTLHTSGKGLSCKRCHYGTTSDNITISSTATHVNRSYDISAPPGETLTYTFSKGGGSCSNTYCHSSAQGINDPTLPPVYSTPLWGNYTSPKNWCGRCHGARYHSWIPAITTGSHGKHLRFEQGSYCMQCHATNHFSTTKFGSCDECHVGRFTTNNRFNDPEHADGVINVAFDKRTPLAGANATYLGDSVPRTPYGGCSSVYCHSQGTSFTEPYPAPNVPSPAWGSSLPSDCSGCHGSDRQSAVQLATGSHQKHIRYNCSFCHNSSVSDSRTAIPSSGSSFSKHVNGYVDVSLRHGGTYAGLASVSRRVGSAPGSCKSGICHNNGTWITTGLIFGSASSPRWGSAGNFTCVSCHDYPPSYQDNSIKPNSHAVHSNYSCNVCHFPTTTDGITISANETHLNQQYDLGNEGPPMFTYTFNTRGSTCSNVSCHAQELKNANWGKFAQEPVSFAPANNSSNLPITAIPSVVFSEDMDPATINISTFQLDNGASGTVNYDQATRTATFVPNSPLVYFNIYTATLSTGVKNISGKPLPHSYTWSFTTAKSALFRAVMTEQFAVPNYSQLPAGWTRVHAAGSNDWVLHTGTDLNECGTYGSTAYITAQNQWYTPILDGELRSPALNLSGYQSVELNFKTSFAAYGYQITADVDVSSNGAAGPWTNVWKRTATYRYYKNETVNISRFAKGQSNVMLRFRFQNPQGQTIPFWQVDDIIVSGDPLN